MKHDCKFCGKLFDSAHYISKKEYSCGECTAYCMKSCKPASTTTMSWHKEPCISCEHNPYKIRHKREEGRWIKNA